MSSEVGPLKKPPMKNESREAEIAEAQKWVPCGNHPIREAGDCTFCAIDALSDEVRRLEALAVGLARALSNIEMQSVEKSKAYEGFAVFTKEVAREMLALPAVAALLSKAAKSQEEST